MSIENQNQIRILKKLIKQCILYDASYELKTLSDEVKQAFYSYYKIKLEKWAEDIISGCYESLMQPQSSMALTQEEFQVAIVDPILFNIINHKVIRVIEDCLQGSLLDLISPDLQPTTVLNLMQADRSRYLTPRIVQLERKFSEKSFSDLDVLSPHVFVKQGFKKERASICQRLRDSNCLIM